jgi:hypothetical protein
MESLAGVRLGVVDRLVDDTDRSMRGKADEAAAAFIAETLGRLETPARADCPVELFLVVDPVDAEQVDILQLQPLKRVDDIAVKLHRIRIRAHLGLDDQLVARQSWQILAQLAF